MSKLFAIPIWKQAPFIRLLPAFIAGILLQWHFQFALYSCIAGIISFSIALLFFLFLPVAVKFRFQFLQGFLLQLLFFGFGLLLTWQNEFRHNNNWYGRYYQNGDYLVVTLSEPLIEKSKSFKADVWVEQVIHNDSSINCKGKLLLYFSKDSIAPNLKYGDRILLKKNLQGIKNSGNPGAFNYQQYAAMQHTYHNAFLKTGDWVKLKGRHANAFQQFIFTSRDNILAVLQKQVSNKKDELGIAEALLIGYTNDLDKDLVQAYSNTGVVHIIAISGMHLGLIYIMLVWLFAKIPLLNKSKAVQVILILSCLWLFSLLTGAAASVTRSAVMFTFITIGKNFYRKSSIFNSLAASAFTMLCYNPYYLWDVGFQLSYLAVVGIIVFQKPIYNWFYIKNKLLNEVWKLAAIALAAQLLTFPVCVYYFHQFPNLFLLTNIVAVPLSSFILFTEIALVAFAWLPFVNTFLGKIVSVLVWLMNQFILLVNNISFSVWDKIPADIFTTILLYVSVIACCSWLLHKNRQLFKLALISFAGFLSMNLFAGWKIKNQEKIIVYNVPQHRAIDFVTGNNFQFIGDSVLLQDGLLQNFHLKPGRIFLQLNNRKDSMANLFIKTNLYAYNNKKILLIDKSVKFKSAANKIEVDLIVVSKNPKINFTELASVFNCKQVVFDASNSLWKIGKWKQECDKLHLRHHSIPELGAFVMDIE